MDRNIAIEKWKKYFPAAELPIAVFYSNELYEAELAKKPPQNQRGYTCLFAQISPVHLGRPLAFTKDNLGCWGAIGNLFGGPFNEDATVHLLCDIERFMDSRENVLKMRDSSPAPSPTGKYIIFMPLDKVTAEMAPEVFLCFAAPDVIAALHALANFDTSEPEVVRCPYGSGCEVALKHALLENMKSEPSCILGGMDTAMRSCLKPDLLTMSIPAGKFSGMVANMDKSFLATYIWQGLKLGDRLTKK